MGIDKNEGAGWQHVATVVHSRRNEGAQQSQRVVLDEAAKFQSSIPSGLPASPSRFRIRLMSASSLLRDRLEPSRSGG
jgi:hypothetical protein